MPIQGEIPVSFLAELVKSKSAMQTFCHLTEGEKQAMINKARSMTSQREMSVLAGSLCTDTDVVEHGEIL